MVLGAAERKFELEPGEPLPLRRGQARQEDIVEIPENSLAVARLPVLQHRIVIEVREPPRLCRKIPQHEKGKKNEAARNGSRRRPARGAAPYPDLPGTVHAA